jgi:hypothetical protein
MRHRFYGSMTTIAAATVSLGGQILLSFTGALAQAPAASSAALTQAPALTTAWGEPDLQGIWTDEFDTALQRPAQLANQEFFTEAQRAELDKTRLATLNRFATEREINGGRRQQAGAISRCKSGPGNA